MVKEKSRFSKTTHNFAIQKSALFKSKVGLNLYKFIKNAF